MPSTIPSYTSLPSSSPVLPLPLSITNSTSSKPISSFRYRRKLLLRPRLHLEELTATETRCIIFCTYLTVIGAIIITVLVGLGYDEHSLIIPALVPCTYVYNSTDQIRRRTTTDFNFVPTSTGTNPSLYSLGIPNEPEDNVYGEGCIENYTPSINGTDSRGLPSSPLNTDTMSGNTKDNSTRWIGTFHGFTALDGDIKLSIDIIPRTLPLLSSSQTMMTMRKDNEHDPISTTWQQTVSYDVFIDGSMDNNENWYTILSIYNTSNLLYCDTGDNSDTFSTGIHRTPSVSSAAISTATEATIRPSVSLRQSIPYCEPFLVLDTAAITNGQGAGGWLHYRIDIVFHNWNISTVAQNATMVLEWETSFYRVTDTGVRIAFFILTCLIVLWYSYRLLWQIPEEQLYTSSTTLLASWNAFRKYPPSKQHTTTHSNAPDETTSMIPSNDPSSLSTTTTIRKVRTYPFQWLPQQRWIIILLCITLLWLNPIFIFTEPLSLISTVTESTANPLSPESIAILRLTTIGLQSVGWSALFCFWWVMADAAKVPKKDIKILAESGLLLHIHTPPSSKRSTTSSHSRKDSSLSVASYESETGTSASSTVSSRSYCCTSPRMQQYPNDPSFGYGCCEGQRRRSTGSSCCCGCGCRSSSSSRTIHGVPYPPTSLCGLYGYKLFFFLLLSATNGTLQILAHPAIVGQAVAGLSSNVSSALPTGYTLLIIITSLTVLNAILLLVWILNFFRALWTTKQQLQLLPYAPTRYHQLAFRFFFFQYLIVVLYVLIINILPLGSFLYNFAIHPRISIVTSSSSTVSTEETRISIETQILNLVNIVTESWSGVGEVVLVSTYVYILAYCHLPPTNRHIIGIVGTGPSATNDNDPSSSSSSATSATPRITSTSSITNTSSSSSNYHIVTTDNNNSLSLLPSSVTKGIERLTHIVMVPAQVAKQAKQVITATVEKTLGLPLDNTIRANYFSLPLACALFDMSFAAYYDPQGFTSTASGCGVIPTAPHGFTFEGTVYDPVTDVFAFVARYQNRIVIAFRGTTSRTHIKMDLKFAPETIYFGDELDSRSLPPSSSSSSGSNTVSSSSSSSSSSKLPPVTKLALPSVHMGFWRSYTSIRYQLFGIVRSALANAGPTARIYCTGHSLGGALASLAAADIAVNKLVVENRKAYFAVHGRSQRLPVRLKPRVTSSTFLRNIMHNSNKQSTFSASTTPLLEDDTENGNDKRDEEDEFYGKYTKESKRSLSTGRIRKDGTDPGEKPTKDSTTTVLPKLKLITVQKNPTDNDRNVRMMHKPTHLSININPPSKNAGKETKPPSPILATLSKPFIVRVDSSNALRTNTNTMSEEDIYADEEAEASATPRAAPESLSSTPLMRSTSSLLSGNVGGASSSSNAIVQGTIRKPTPTVHENGSVTSSPWKSLNEQLRDNAEDNQLEDAVNQHVRTDLPEKVVDSILHPPSLYHRLWNRTTTSSTTIAHHPHPPSVSSLSLQENSHSTHPLPSSTTDNPTTTKDTIVTADDQYNDIDPLGFGTLFVSDPLDCIGLPPDVEEWDDANDQEYLQLLELNTIENTTNLSIQRSIQETLNNSLFCDGDVVTVSFGAPRVGNSIWSVFMNKKVPRSYRMMVDGDLVTSIPSLIGFFRHHGIQVWLDTLGNMIVNPSFVEKQFRASSRTSINAHRLVTYRRSLVYARRNEGLPQFRTWAASQLQPVQSSSTT